MMFFGVMKNSSRQLGSIKNVGEIFRTMGPLIGSLSRIAVASRAGFFNVGYQTSLGWLTAAVCSALSFPDIPRILMIPLTVLVAAIAGSLV